MLSIQTSFHRHRFYILFLIIFSLIIMLPACGGGGGGSDNNDDITEPTVAGTEIDMWAGGTASSADGVTVEALEGSWSGTVEVVFEPTETNTDPVEDGFPASDVYVIRLNGFETGETTVPFKVTMPVTTTDLPTPIDEYAFAIETYNEDTGQWERNDAMAEYDENTGSVTFWANHFSKKRVVYVGEDPKVELDRYVYKSEHNKFYITYFAPVTFNKPSNHLPPSNPEWQGSGTATDPAVPDYIEDLGKALETALTYHTTKIIKPDGYLLFDDPTFDAPSLEDNAISVTVKKIPAKGDTRLGGPVRIDTGLKNWHEMKVVAAHELVHYLSDQYYTGTGARINRWFFEAIAEFYGTRAAGYTKDECTTYFSNYYNYLKVSLDASDEKSYYAIGDFLYWLEDKMNYHVTAGVVTSNYTWDISGLDNLLQDLGSSLGDEYTQYVLECTVGDHELRALNIKTSISFTDTSLYKKLKFKLPHLTGKHVRVNPYLAADGMLVAESGVDYQYGGGIPLKTYSYTDATIPVADIDNNLEKTTETDKPVVVKHFGKKGTAGVQYSVFNQIIINPLVGDVTVGGGEYYFDYYILVPPETKLQFDGKITWTFPDYGELNSSIKGFHVYSDGVQLTNTPIVNSFREYSDIRIRSTSDVQVTVVDKYDNEWPEVENAGLQPNWEMSIYINNTADDINNYGDATVRTWHTDIWIPVTVSSNGSVTVDHRFAPYANSPEDDKIHHLWGTGTYRDEKLMINGNWTTNETYTNQPGPGDVTEHKVDGTFSLAGHFLSGFFFSDSDESHATANVRHTTTYANPDFVTRIVTGSNTPDMTIEDFRPIQ